MICFDSFSGDLSTKEGIHNVSLKVRDKETHLDILCSNAGVRRDPPIAADVKHSSIDDLRDSMWSSNHSDWTNTFKINVTAHYFLSVALMQLLANAGNMDLPDGRKGRDEGRGSIVITSSCASMHNCTNVDLTSYAASKAATDHLVKLLAAKFGKWYIRVNSINPGCELMSLLKHIRC